MLGLILAGGGARGAYEAGVLRFIFDELPRRGGPQRFPKIICGTSIGAITATWLAAHGAPGAVHLSEMWQHLQPHQVYNLSALDLVEIPFRFLRRNPPIERATALLDPTPLASMIRDLIPWSSLYSRIDRGDIDALVLAATDVACGKATLFTDGFRSPRPRPTTLVQRGRLKPEHCLASAAIPFVFPPVHVGNRYYVDGSLRQNTPLSPAISLGATRVLVVGVKKPRTEEEPISTLTAPSPSFLAGKALKALMLDPVEEDFRQLQVVNDFIRWGSSAFPDFLSRMRQEYRPFRPVKSVFIRPSAEIGTIATDVFRQYAGELACPTRALLRALYGGPESDLMSFLYFHHRFTAALEALGFEDAQAQENEIAELLLDEDHPLEEVRI